jgi:hypothetical protein
MTSRHLIRIVLGLVMTVPGIMAACGPTNDIIEYDEVTDDASLGGSGGSGGNAAGSGGSGQGSCQPSFCPSGGMGSPCCIAPEGPCGVNLGMGCALPPTADN